MANESNGCMNDPPPLLFLYHSMFIIYTLTAILTHHGVLGFWGRSVLAQRRRRRWRIAGRVAGDPRCNAAAPRATGPEPVVRNAVELVRADGRF